MRTRLRWLLLLLGMVMIGLAPADALAKKKKGKKKKRGEDVELIGVNSFDKVFRQVKKLDHQVDDAEKDRKKGKKNVATAMGLKPRTSLGVAVKDLQKRGGNAIQVVQTGAVPKLEAPDAPPDVQKGVQAMNTALANYTSTLQGLAAVPEQATELISKVKDFPMTLKDEVASNPVKALTMIKKVKTTKSNVDIALKIPKRVHKVTAGLTGDVNLIVTAFGGVPIPGLN